MKKLFFLMPFALLAFASCSNDEVETKAVQKSADAVNFLPAMNNATRGTIYTDAGFSTDPASFNVIAVGNFYTSDPSGTGNPTPSNQTVNSAVTYTTGAWTLGTPLWWGDGTSTAKFTAFAGAEFSAVSSGSLSFNAESTIASQKDLVVAYNEGSRTDFSSGVPLHFRHALSQIIVNASYAVDASQDITKFPDLTIKVKQIRFKNIYGTGNLTLPLASTAAGETYTPSWTTTGATTSYTSSVNEQELASAPKTLLAAADGAMLLVPQNVAAATSLAAAPTSGAYLEVYADIDYKTAQSGKINVYPTFSGTGDESAENKFAWIAVPVTIAWDGGYKYTYTLNFSNVACGKVSPNDTPTGSTAGDDVIPGVPYPVNFLVTVEDTWQDGGTTTPSL